MYEDEYGIIDRLNDLDKKVKKLNTNDIEDLKMLKKYWKLIKFFSETRFMNNYLCEVLNSNIKEFEDYFYKKKHQKKEIKKLKKEIKEIKKTINK